MPHSARSTFFVAVVLFCLLQPSLSFSQTNETGVFIEDGGPSVENVSARGAEKIQVGRLEGASETEAETMLFDLYLADNLRGSILIEYTDDWFEIPTPQDVLDQFPSVKQPDKILELLSHRIFRSLKIDKVGEVYYDLDTFSITVVLDPLVLFGKEITLSDRIPDPENKFSLQQSFRAAISGDLEASLDTTFSHNSLASVGKSWIIYNGAFVQTSEYELNDFSINSIFSDVHVQAGLLFSEGLFLASSKEFTGLSLRNTDEVYLNQDLLRGSKLEVYVPSRARVDFFRGERLLSSQVLGFGLQEVDTSSFPQGSYDVEIVIREDNGAETRERQFFTKSGLLSVRNRPTYLLQGGIIRDQLSLQDVPIFQFESKWRVHDFVQFTGSAYGTDEEQIGAASLLGIWRSVTFEAGALSSVDSDSAIKASLNVDFMGFYGDFRITKSLSGFEDDKDEISSDSVELDPLNPVIPTLDDELSDEEEEKNTKLIGRAQETLSASISKRLGNVTWRLSGKSNQTGDDDERYSYGGNVDWDIIRSRDHTLRARMGYFSTDDGEETNLGLGYTYRFGNWTAQTGIQHVGQSSDNEQTFANAFQYDNRVNSRFGTKAIFVDETKRQEKRADVDTIRTNRLGIEHTNKYLYSRAALRNRRKSDNNSTTISAEAETSFNITGEGAVTMSDPLTSQSVFIAEVKSQSTESEVEVLVNGQPQAVIKANSKAVIGINPFKKYKFAIRPTVDADLVHYDTTTHETTVYPGNIVKHTWHIEKVYIGLGRLLDEDGKPIAWHRIRGLPGYSVTEEDGSFQIEMTGTNELNVKSNDYDCVIDIPEHERAEFFVDFGDVVCRSR